MRRAAYVILTIGVLCGGAWADVGAAKDDEPARKPRHGSVARPRAAPEPASGFWPTDQLVENWVLRITDSVADQYGLTDEQAARLDEMSIRRWKPFINDLRPVAQPLVNQFIEAKFAPKPPDPEMVKRWAKQAKRVFETIRGEMEAAQTEFAKILTPEQKPKFEADVLKFTMSTQTIEQKLKQWEQGKFAEREWWEPTRRERRRRREREAAARAAASTQPVVAAHQGTTTTDAADTAMADVVSLDKWEKFVQDFIARYELDESQQTSARSILRGLKERASAYRQGHEDEYVAIERQLAQAEKADRDELLSRRRELDGPIGDMFEELRERLDGLLTSAQREMARTGKK